MSGTNLTVRRPGTRKGRPPPCGSAITAQRLQFLLDWLETQPIFASVKAVGHRVVHGMQHSAPECVTPELLEELHRITSLLPIICRARSH